ncbi:MAG: shikimate kinase [Dehalococcoidales bacterium]|nr:shikimate kinase [Dehalococcoidales bacterium]
MRKEGVILIGMAGTGKSTIGSGLARALAFDFTDLDEYICSTEGQTIQCIINDKGEDALLLLEKQRMHELNMKHRVIAPGGSIVYLPDLMRYLKEHSFLVHLDDTFENIQGRLENASNRGIIGFKSKSLREIYDERHPLYYKYADINIDQAGKSKEKIIKEIIEQLPGLFLVNI